jgi:hypothetical protein
MQLGDDAIRSIVAHLAHMRAEHGEVLEEAETILPTGEFFPDDFKLDPEGIERLMQRMATYFPLPRELHLALGFIQPEEEAKAGGCGSGACGPGGASEEKRHVGAVETPDGYGVLVHVTDVGEPKLLTAALARSLGRVVLFAAEEPIDARDEGPLAELTAVSCGLGPILLGGAAVYKKGCGGMRMHQGTFLSIEELSLALALFLRVKDEKAGGVKRHLEVTQREAFDEALAWVDAQPKLVRRLRNEPETLTDGIFELETKQGVLARLFARKKDDDDMPLEAAPPSKRAPKSEEELRRLAEAKALVEEAFQDS